MLRSFSRFVDPFADRARTTLSSDPPTFLRQSFRPFRFILGASLVLTVISASFEIWLIAYTSTLVDVLVSSTPQTLWADHGPGLVLAALAILILRPLAGGLREALDDIAFRANATTSVRWLSHRHVVGHSVGWFRRDFSGRIASQVRDLGASATGVVYSLVHTLAFVSIYVMGAIGFVASIDWRLTLPILVWLVGYLALMLFAVPRIKRLTETFQERYAAMTGHLVDTYANIELVKLFSRASTEDVAAREAFDGVRQVHLDVDVVEVTINGTMMFLSSLLLVGLAGTGIVLWQAGAAPVGLVAAALALSFRLTGMAEWMLDAVSSLFALYGAMRQSLGTIAQPHEIVDAPGAPDLSVGHAAIAFRGAGYRYGKETGGVTGIDLDIAPGEKIGLVGRSGAGKSTLVNLLLRYFDLETGSIAIDGQSVAAVTQESLRSAIAMVGQDAPLFNRSVRDNIAYGLGNVPDTDVLAAARRAAAEKFIAELVDGEGSRGLDAHVGERGIQLSGGQRQRIAIARAILKNAPILILDEATSALDSEIEADIQDALGEVMAGKTVIAIAHRLSTLARMDRIVVLDEGRIAETGTHAELLAANGIYAGLWNRQVGGFIV